MLELASGSAVRGKKRDAIACKTVAMKPGYYPLQEAAGMGSGPIGLALTREMASSSDLELITHSTGAKISSV
jgi:hypothetical protein